jgi:hypothetical protein
MKSGLLLEGEIFYHSAVVVLFCSIRRRVVLQVFGNGAFLVPWHRKYIAKATTAVGAHGLLLTSALWIIHCQIRIDLCRPNGSDVRTRRWKYRAESVSAYREMLP